MSNSFMPDHIKALSIAYSWFFGNEVYFQKEEDKDEEHTLNHERYGWVRKDAKHGFCICFVPDKLSKYLNTEIGPNTYEAVTDEWKALSILIPKEQTDSKTGAIIKRKKNQISTTGGKTQVIKIPFSKFEEYLKLEKEEEETQIKNTEDNNNKPQAPKEQTQTAFKALSVGIKVVNSIDALEEITCTAADNIITADNDTELADLLKQEGF